jgi:hypothetical protein
MREEGPPCKKCRGQTYVSTWGSSPVHRITYCKGCNKMPDQCRCPKREGSFR